MSTNTLNNPEDLLYNPKGLRFFLSIESTDSYKPNKVVSKISFGNYSELIDMYLRFITPEEKEAFEKIDGLIKGNDFEKKIYELSKRNQNDAESYVEVLKDAVKKSKKAIDEKLFCMMLFYILSKKFEKPIDEELFCVMLFYILSKKSEKPIDGEHIILYVHAKLMGNKVFKLIKKLLEDEINSKDPKKLWEIIHNYTDLLPFFKHISGINDDGLIIRFLDNKGLFKKVDEIKDIKKKRKVLTIVLKGYKYFVKDKDYKLVEYLSKKDISELPNIEDIFNNLNYELNADELIEFLSKGLSADVINIICFTRSMLLKLKIDEIIANLDLLKKVPNDIPVDDYVYICNQILEGNTSIIHIYKRFKNLITKITNNIKYLHKSHNSYNLLEEFVKKQQFNTETSNDLDISKFEKEYSGASCSIEFNKNLLKSNKSTNMDLLNEIYENFQKFDEHFGIDDNTGIVVKLFSLISKSTISNKLEIIKFLSQFKDENFDNLNNEILELLANNLSSLGECNTLHEAIEHAKQIHEAIIKKPRKDEIQVEKQESETDKKIRGFLQKLGFKDEDIKKHLRNLNKLVTTEKIKQSDLDKIIDSYTEQDKQKCVRLLNELKAVNISAEKVKELLDKYNKKK